MAVGTAGDFKQHPSFRTIYLLGFNPVNTIIYTAIEKTPLEIYFFQH